jgi:hypothetical protein
MPWVRCLPGSSTRPPHDAAILFAGGLRSKVEATIMRGLDTLRGAPDIVAVIAGTGRPVKVPNMTTPRQAEANRRNARKSTGPRSPAGKAAVGLNNMKHGLLSRASLVKGESEAELVDFGKRLRSQLAPVGELELLLADRMVSTAWRLRRLVSLEAMLFDREEEPDAAFIGYGREKMGILSRYEVTLERSLYKALHELQRLQAGRAGQPVPLPEAVDVDVFVSGPDEADRMALTGKNRAVVIAP